MHTSSFASFLQNHKLSYEVQRNVNEVPANQQSYVEGKWPENGRNKQRKTALKVENANKTRCEHILCGTEKVAYI